MRIQQGYSQGTAGGTVRVQQGYSQGTAGVWSGYSRGYSDGGWKHKNNAKTSICDLYLL